MDLAIPFCSGDISGGSGCPQGTFELELVSVTMPLRSLRGMNGVDVEKPELEGT